jgi:hypothetical protein
LNWERDIVGTVNCVAKSQQGCDDAWGVHVRTMRKVAQLAGLAVSVPSSMKAVATFNLLAPEFYI